MAKHADVTLDWQNNCLERDPLLAFGRSHKWTKKSTFLRWSKAKNDSSSFFDDMNRDETLRQLARFAADPEIEFSWYDAAMLSQKIREAVPTDEDFLASQEFDSLSLDDFH